MLRSYVICVRSTIE